MKGLRLSSLFLFLFAVAGALAAGSAFAESSAPTTPFTVTGIQVDEQANNAVQAREKAFAQALESGFTRLLEQVVPDEAARTRIALPEPSQLGALLQDFSVTHEQLGANRYTATYDLRFKPARVQAFLEQGRAALAPLPINTPQGATFPLAATTPNPSFLILPFYQDRDKMVLWSSTNPLRDAFAQQAAGDTPLKLTLGDLDDMQIFDESRGVAYSPDQMRRLLQKYETDQAIVAVGIPDQAGTGLTVMMYRATSQNPNPVYTDAISIVRNAHEAPMPFYARTAARVRAQALNAPALAAQTPPAAQPEMAALLPTQTVDVLVRFQNLAEWQQIRNRLSAIETVKALRVISLKTQEARAEIVYAGPEDDFLSHLQTAGLSTVLPPEHMNDSLSPTDMEPAAGPRKISPAYEITLTRQDATRAAVSADPSAPFTAEF